MNVTKQRNVKRLIWKKYLIYEQIEKSHNSIKCQGFLFASSCASFFSLFQKVPKKKRFAWRHCIHWPYSQNWAAAKTNLSYRKITITVFFFVANKKYRLLKLLWCLLALNSSILSLIWSGAAYFVVNYTNTFLLGDGDQQASWWTWATHFWRQTKSLETQNVLFFPFLNLHNMLLRL